MKGDAGRIWEKAKINQDTRYRSFVEDCICFENTYSAFCSFSDFYFQVILMLTTDLDGDDEKDKGALDNLLSQLIAELCMEKKASCSTSTQS